MEKLKPYGTVRPVSLKPRHLRAWLLGVRDGWRQPRDLATTANVERFGWDAQDSMDAGANLGQWLRSPLNHQRP